MPYPTVTVVFKDADGDEFPVVASPGPYEIDAARRTASELIDDHTWRPNGKLQFVRVER